MVKFSGMALVMLILNFSCGHRATYPTNPDSEDLNMIIDTFKFNFDHSWMDTIDLIKYTTDSNEGDDIKMVVKNEGEHTADIKLAYEEKCLQISKDSIAKNETVEIKVNVPPQSNTAKKLNQIQLILTTAKYKDTPFLQIIYQNSSATEKEVAPLLFDNEEYDFGKIQPEEEKINCSFKFSNTSAHDIKFTRCMASHGMATCNFDQKIVPNAVDSIGFEMFVKGKRGKFTKRITLKGYPDKCPRVYFEKYLTIKGEIITHNK